MSVGGEAKPLSFDHKPTNQGETSRIVAAGGFVEFGRVNGATKILCPGGGSLYGGGGRLTVDVVMTRRQPRALAGTGRL